MDLNVLDRPPRWVASGSLGNPGADDLILPGPGSEPQPSLVRHQAGRLEQEEAAVGVDDVHPTAEQVAGKRGIVPLRVVTEEAEVQTPRAPGTSRDTSRRCSRAARTDWPHGGRNRRARAPIHPASEVAAARRPARAGPPSARSVPVGFARPDA